MKKFTSFILTALIIISSAPVSLAAFEEEPTISYMNEYFDNNGTYYEEYVDEDGDVVSVDDYYSEEIDEISASALPTTWDSREYGWITNVKNQGSFGTCWAFSACSAAETSLIKQGYADTSINLSEAHLARFIDSYVEGSDIPFQKDRLIYNTGTNLFSRGGNFLYATAALARGSGFTTEEKYPYSLYSSADMMFDDSFMLECDYMIDHVRFLHTTEDIKQAVMDSGSACISYYHNYANSRQMPDGTSAYYQNIQTGTNHGITIVGWDDNYDKTIFLTDAPQNGAWLCKNSWGTKTMDTGYVWISYYDTSLSYGAEFVVKSNSTDYIYQYNGNYTAGSFSLSSAITVANVFTANGNEYIKGVGFNAANGNYDCKISLYVDLPNPSTSPIGTLKETVSIETVSNGYYTINFNDKYKLEEGQPFSLVATFTNKTTGESSAAMCEMATSASQYSIEAGQSFYRFYGSQYKDVMSYNNVGNFSMKGLVVYEKDNPVKSIEISNLPHKTEFITNELFDYSGLTVSEVYEDNTTRIIDDYIVSQPDMTREGSQTVTVSSNSFETSYEINITNVNNLISNANLNIDYSSDVISGFNMGFNSLDDYFITTPEYNYECSSYGTGGTITIYRNSKQVHTFTIILYGDVNSDGWCDGQDAIIVNCLANVALSESDVSEYSYKAADCNRDNVINESDSGILVNAGVFIF